MGIWDEWAVQQQGLALPTDREPGTVVWDEEPVPLNVFVSDVKYLGWPPPSPIQYEAIRHIERIYLPETYGVLAQSSDPAIREYWSQPYPMVNFIPLEWGKGGGKDYTCQVASLRVAYLLLCLPQPQSYYKMPLDATIHLLNVAASAPQANNVFFTPLRRVVTRPRGWFTDRCDPIQGMIRYAKNIEAISGHSDAETQEGLNILLGVADEIDAFKRESELAGGRPGAARESTKSAEAIVNMMRTSAATRFPKVFKNVWISWPRYRGSMIQTLLEGGQKDNEARGPASRFYVSGPVPTWVANPARASGPEDFAQDYEDDPRLAKARYECEPSAAMNPYFANEQALEDAQRPVERQPLEFTYVRHGSSWEVEWDFGADLKPVQGAIYAMHADLAKSGDRAGIAMAHVATFEEVTVLAIAPDGREVAVPEMRPHVKVDFVASFEASLSAVPPREIQIRWARSLCLELRRRGFNVRRFTADQFQSLDTFQILATHGIETDRVSTDLNADLWRQVRDLAAESRATWPERPRLLSELLALNKLPNGKVDHPPSGSKDEADALAGAIEGAVLLGGQEDPDGRLATVEPELEEPLWGPLAEYLPVGLEMAGGLGYNDMMHTEPVKLDALGYPMTSTPEEEAAALEQMPGWGGEVPDRLA